MSDEKVEVKREFDFPLTTSFPYGAGGGDLRDAEFIKLTAPTSRNSNECAALKQAFWRSAHRDVQETKDDKDDSDIDIKGQDVIVMLAMSQNVDLPDVMATARRLFTKGKVATVDGEANLTQPLFDLMSQEDTEAMLGEYLVNFTLASSLAQIKKQSLKG